MDPSRQRIDFVEYPLFGLEMMKGVALTALMLDESKTEALNAAIIKLIGREAKPRTLLAGNSPLIDVSRANLHESKKEFMVELAAVQAVVENLESIIEHIVPNEEKIGPERKAMLDRLRVAVDAKALQQARRRSLSTAGDLALKNIFDTGFHFGSMRLIIAMFLIYRERLSELKDQEKQFWTVSSRPPNYYARSMALRLARLYAREKGQRPTFGMSREGNFPSTDFGRALEEVFRILGIKASVRNAATWALDQLSDDDLRPSTNALATFFGSSEPRGVNFLDTLSGR